MLNYGQKPASDIKITSNEIQLENVLTLIKAALNSLHIKHELHQVHGSGHFSIDTYVKTNFKKLISNGNITINDCIVKNYEFVFKNMVLRILENFLNIFHQNISIINL